jgi:hypothetical protein
MAEIMYHPWYLGDTPSAEEIREQFSKRDQAVKAAALKDQQAKQQQKQQIVNSSRQAMRGEGEE